MKLIYCTGAGLPACAWPLLVLKFYVFCLYNSSNIPAQVARSVPGSDFLLN